MCISSALPLWIIELNEIDIALFAAREIIIGLFMHAY